MKRKKLISKLALPVAIVFVISIVILILQHPYRNAQYKKHVARLQNHIAELTTQNQNYLKEAAKKITAVPVSEIIVQEFQSEYIQMHQQLGQPKKYLWLMDSKGDFVFGVPANSFLKINNAYDRYIDTIKLDGHFIDRNDFLMKLIDKYDRIDFSEFTSRDVDDNDNFQWRFFKETNLQRYYWQRPQNIVLSTSVLNNDGEVTGTLHLKVDDETNNKLYASKYMIERSDLYSLLIPIFGVIAFLTGVFLWFLLPTWVYIDSQQRDVKNTGLWAFLALISGPFGLTIYLITRPQTTKSLNCPQCEKELNGTKAFCPYCGFDVSKTFCPQCQYPVKQDWEFCPSCRAELKKGRMDVPLLEENDDVKKIGEKKDRNENNE